MKINEYIKKKEIKGFTHSNVSPTVFPPQAFSEELLEPSFKGTNADRSIFVTTYEAKGFFVVYENRIKKRIVGNMSEDLEDLD